MANFSKFCLQIPSAKSQTHTVDSVIPLSSYLFSCRRIGGGSAGELPSANLRQFRDISWLENSHFPLTKYILL